MENNEVKYPHNALEGFANGCLLDMRVRIAIELLKSSPIFSGGVGVIAMSEDPAHAAERAPKDFASMALDVATELLRLGAERGLVDPLPADDGELSPSLRSQAKRTASFQVLQQMEGQKFGQREQDQVIPQAPGRLVNPRH